MYDRLVREWPGLLAQVECQIRLQCQTTRGWDVESTPTEPSPSGDGLGGIEKPLSALASFDASLERFRQVMGKGVDDSTKVLKSHLVSASQLSEDALPGRQWETFRLKAVQAAGLLNAASSSYRGPSPMDLGARPLLDGALIG